jgi:tetratricopeptide (TPR) repeat protein
METLPMLVRNTLSALAIYAFAVVHFTLAETNLSDSFAKIAEQSRHLADAGQWEAAKAVLDDELAKTDDPVEIARLKAELAHYAADRSTYFHKDESSVLTAVTAARSMVDVTGDKRALATLEMAEGRFTYFKALDKTKDWAPPTDHFDRAQEIYKKLGDEIGLGEAMFYRGLVYQMQGQSRQARETFDQALELTKKSADERMQSFVVRHIGYLQQSAGEIDAARTNFQESLELRQRNYMKVFVPFAMIALAEFETEQKNSTEAVKLVEEALPLGESGNSPRALYSGQLVLAKLYADEGKTAEAKKLAEQSRAGAEAFGDPGGMKEAEDFLQKYKDLESSS